MDMLAHVAISFSLWIGRAARLLNHIRWPLEHRGWWATAATVQLVQDGIELVSEWLWFHAMPPLVRAGAIVRVGDRVSNRLLVQMNGDESRAYLQCMVAYSGYAWTPAGVAVLSARRFPGVFGAGVASRVRETLEMWSAHHPGVFEKR